ncbi:MAG: hypothetical protein Tsb0014_45700 [Pleurocapsa sp.]
MIPFVFSSQVLAGIESGAYEIVRNKTTGQLIGIARDKITGQFVEVAKASVINSSGLFGLLSSPLNLVTSGAIMYQNHRGFQKTYSILDNIQTSIGVLQGTTALIGLGTITGMGLSAVNLYQVLKLKENVKQLQLEIKDGFIDLKELLAKDKQEIIDRINLIARDTEFRQHRIILSQAYNRFIQATNCLKNALKIEDEVKRNAAINIAQKILYDALADYKNPVLQENNNLAGNLRIKECSWIIEQTLIITYQLQNIYSVVTDRLLDLQKTIRQDAIEIIDLCQSEMELDFIFPEINYIRDRDLVSLENWHDSLSWMMSLSSAEHQMLIDLTIDQEREKSDTENIIEPEFRERDSYQKIKSKSHFKALKDLLKFAIAPELRTDYETYISQAAVQQNRPALAPSNWQEIPHLTVANIYWYFKDLEQVEIN